MKPRLPEGEVFVTPTIRARGTSRRIARRSSDRATPAPDTRLRHLRAGPLADRRMFSTDVLSMPPGAFSLRRRSVRNGSLARNRSIHLDPCSIRGSSYD